MSKESVTNNASWIEISILAQASARDLAHRFVEETKINPGIISASILPFETALSTDLINGKAERIGLELEPSAAPALLAQIMRLAIPRLDKADNGVTVILRNSSGQSVEISGSLTDGEFLRMADEILRIICGQY
jgi:hypothetical protein